MTFFPWYVKKKKKLLFSFGRNVTEYAQKMRRILFLKKTIMEKMY